jgi:hypothetical protein
VEAADADDDRDGGTAVAARTASADAARRRRKRRGRFRAGIAVTAAALGVASSFTGLIDWLEKHLTKSPPPRIDARITGVEARNGRETLADYLAESHQPRTGYSSAQVRQRGYVFLVGVRIRGGVGERLPLTWALHRADTDEPLRDSYSRGVVGHLEPESVDDTNSWPAWIPPPAGSGRYYVRFVLTDPRGRLSFAETRPFTYRSP